MKMRFAASPNCGRITSLMLTFPHAFGITGFAHRTVYAVCGAGISLRELVTAVKCSPSHVN
jgi:hypothetical protein